MFTIGIDIQNISEISTKKYISRGDRVLRKNEIDYAKEKRNPVQTIAGLIAAKEAFFKATSGLVGIPLYGFKSISIIHAPNGRPAICLDAKIASYFDDKNLACDLSISHSVDYACACVIIFTR